MNRGEVWCGEVGGKRRPVVILTRPEVVDVRKLVTVAEITTTIRGLAVEVRVDQDEAGLAKPSVVNCDGLHTMRRSELVNRVGKLSDLKMRHICQSVAFAIGG